MGTFSIADMLSNKTKTEALQIPSGHFRTEDISIKRMYRNKENRYNLYNIEELASNIQAVGLRQNLEVIYDPCEDGDYRILSGERRWLALNQLVEEGYKEYEIVTCKVCCPASANMEKLELMATNSYREKNNADLMMEVKEATETFRRLKEEGAKVPGYDLQSGRIRDIVASFLGLSRTKVAQIESINNNLIEALKMYFKAGKIPFSVAYETSGAERKLQLKALRRYHENGGKLSLKDIKEVKAQFEEQNIPGQIEMDIQEPDWEEKKEEAAVVRMPTFTRMENSEDASKEVKAEAKETKENTGVAEEQKQCVKMKEPDSTEKDAEVPNKIIPDAKSDSEDEEYIASKAVEIEGEVGTWYKPDEYVPRTGTQILVAINSMGDARIHEGTRMYGGEWVYPVKTAEGGYAKCWRMDEDIFAWMRMPEYKEE